MELPRLCLALPVFTKNAANPRSKSAILDQGNVNEHCFIGASAVKSANSHRAGRKAQRVKSATMTLTPATAAQATKNAIVVTNTGQTAQIISSSSQVISGSPIMVTNANLVQQLTSGKPVNCNRQPSCNT
ncbi:uncharacterized protein [Temnothorax nylanderi]|uniref:uncharacterized protein isoform X1 n=1 Tax=Temnothorax nylanderi TaxID=102681 RepID=UPI003A84C9D0